MPTPLPPVYFYLPEHDWPDPLPTSANEYWQGFSRGIYSWTLQTYLHLSAHDVPCQLVKTLPETGIVLAHRESLPYELTPTHQVLLVCLKADQDAHPYAQYHIVQNPHETRRLRNSLYIPHWPQPGLQPRDATRGCRVENVAYMGISYNLAPELKDVTWKETLRERGFTWQIRPRECWHDYSDVDVVVAVRAFQNREYYHWKPATKLYNCWHAGVPALLGCESAFRAERKGEFDYIEVRSPNEILQTLTQLKSDPQLYHDIVNNGQIRSRETNQSSLVEKWKQAFYKQLSGEYKRWTSLSRWQQTAYINQCYAKIKLTALRKRLFLKTSE